MRKFEQKQAEIELGKALAEEQKIQDSLDDIAAKRVKVTEDSNSIHDIYGMMHTQQLLSLLDIKQESFLEELSKAKLVSEQKRAVLTEAMQKAKVLEKLREKKFENYKKEMLKLEETENDEIVTSHYGKL
ncbi:MAG: flagellar export protein FliJ [Treponema sp.]|nr:flagellar export protein FliJ [Treponema sp.]